jgi:hypothetical protein
VHRDQHGAGDAHRRIEPGRAEETATDEREYGEDRCGGIGEHVHIGRTHVEILVTVAIMRGVVIMRRVVIVMAAQPPGADQIDEQADGGDRDRFIVVDGLRSQQAIDRLEAHERGDAEQEQCAAVATQHFDFPRAERVTPVGGVPAREGIRKCRQAQRQRVRAHVPAIGEHRHRIEPPAARDLDDHHRGGEPHRPPDVTLGEWVAGVEAGRVAVMLHTHRV